MTPPYKAHPVFPQGEGFGRIRKNHVIARAFMPVAISRYNGGIPTVAALPRNDTNVCRDTPPGCPNVQTTVQVEDTPGGVSLQIPTGCVCGHGNVQKVKFVIILSYTY